MIGRCLNVNDLGIELREPGQCRSEHNRCCNDVGRCLDINDLGIELGKPRQFSGSRDGS